MALVAYDNSDCSDYEDEENEITPVEELVTNFTKPVVSTVVSSQPEREEPLIENGPTLFNFLPQPDKKKTVIEEDDEFLHKKEAADVVKPKAKINVPSLSDFKDVESTVAVAKPKPSSGKKSGLLSMLPEPRNGLFIGSTKSLIPNVLAQKPSNVKKKIPTPMKPKQEVKTLVTGYSDESDDDDLQNDFFSFNKPIELPEPELPLDIPSENPAETQMSKIESYFKKDVVQNHVELQSDEQSYSEYEESEASSSYTNGSEAADSCNGDQMVLDDEAILKLCGSRGKRKREDIQIVDVDQKEVLAEAQQMFMKGLMEDTSKRVSVSKKRGNEPTNMQKRKHQITYLAHQAKANEAELQNQWANNRMSKRKTQSKYGF